MTRKPKTPNTQAAVAAMIFHFPSQIVSMSFRGSISSLGSVALNGGSLDYERLEAVRFVEGVAGGAIDYDGAREWVAARLAEGDPQG